MGTTLRLHLKPGYREPLGSGIGFVGRDAELARLVAVLRHRPAATVLVSGHRGVGKTTLVDEALRRTDEKRRVVARLSLPHINPDSNDTSRDLRGQILRSLARSLHFGLKEHKGASKEVRSVAQNLYDKTYLRDLQEQGQLEALTQAEVKQVHAVQHETRLEPGKLVNGVLGAAAGGAVATAGVSVAALVATRHGAVFGALSLLVVIASSIAAAVTATRTTSHEQSATSQILRKDSTTKVGTFDLSPETLEFELKGLLGKLAGEGLRPVFVIDELDKLEVGAAGDDSVLEEHTIFAILSSLKNFFTLGSGIFIFISGEDFYARLEESDQAETYSLAHTLFTDRVFVHVLRWNDVEKLIDNVVDEDPADVRTFRRFRNYLCWESRNHAFDLLTRIGDYVTEYDGDAPVLVARESTTIDGRWHEGNLPADWTIAAAMQKIVGATFDESVRPGGREERFNQALWLVLLDAAKHLVRIGYIVVPKAGSELQPSRWTSHLLPQDVDDLAGAVDRLYARAERYGIVTTTETSIESDKDAEVAAPTSTDAASGSVPATEYAVVSNPQYPDSSVGQHAAPSPFEQGFLRVAKAAREVADNLVEAGLDLATHIGQLEEVEGVAQQVDGRTTRQAPPRSRVRSALRQADSLLPALWAAGVDKLIDDWAEEGGFEVFVPDDENGKAAPAQANNPRAPATPPPDAPANEVVDHGAFADFFEALHDSDVAYHLIASPRTENQVLVLEGITDNAERFQNLYAAALPGRKGQERRVQRLPVVEVRRMQPDDVVDFPTEVVTVVGENPAVGFVAWFRSVIGVVPEAAGRQVTEKLAGWEIFGLRPDASNISDLWSILTQVSYLSVGDEAPGDDAATTE